jgi:hypothetical protein
MKRLKFFTWRVPPEEACVVEASRRARDSRNPVWRRPDGSGAEW